MMTFRFVPVVAAAVLIGGSASADPFVDAVVRDFQRLGYEYIEVERGPTQLKAEGVRGREQFEVIYDLASGRILKQETETADDDYTGLRGVETATRVRDFIDLEDEEDDDDRRDEDEDEDEDDDRRDDDDEEDDDDDDRRDDDDDEEDDDRSGSRDDDDEDDDDRSGSDSDDDDESDDDSGSDDDDDDGSDDGDDD
jgi:hypothetical protein